MKRNERLYFDFLTDFVCSGREKVEFSKVLEQLFYKTFISYDELDDNLIYNSMELREKYSKSYIFDFDCTVLELMVYLSIEIEDSIMANNEYGDRTGLWFWSMMSSLGLNFYDNFNYNSVEIDRILENFIEKRYEKSGKGGLFAVKNPSKNARNENIWSQAMNFVSEFAQEDGEIL